MDQLVRQQQLSFVRCRRVLLAAEYYVLSYCVRSCVHRTSRLCRLRVRVHAHATEVVAETGLHEASRFCIEWLPRRSQHVVDDWWHRIVVSIDRLMTESGTLDRALAFLITP